MLIVFGVIVFICALWILYMKYRVVFGGDKCKGTIVGVVSQNGGYVVGGVQVRKKSYIVKINRNSMTPIPQKYKKYYSNNVDILCVKVITYL